MRQPPITDQQPDTAEQKWAASPTEQWLSESEIRYLAQTWPYNYDTFMDAVFDALRRKRDAIYWRRDEAT
jgi:hypothetical protein